MKFTRNPAEANRQTDDQHETIILCHYHVAGYKNPCHLEWFGSPSSVCNFRQMQNLRQQATRTNCVTLLYISSVIYVNNMSETLELLLYADDTVKPISGKEIGSMEHQPGTIAPDKALFSYFSTKTYAVGTH